MIVLLAFGLNLESFLKLLMIRSRVKHGTVDNAFGQLVIDLIALVDTAPHPLSSRGCPTLPITARTGWNQVTDPIRTAGGDATKVIHGYRL